MSVVNFLFPPVVRFGEGCLSLLEKENIPKGPGVIITGGKSAKKSKALGRAVSYLEKRGDKVYVFDGVEPEVSVETADKASEYCRKTKAVYVIGLGGGSALDCAKAAAGCAPGGCSVTQYLEDKAKLNNSPLYFVAVPTTAGTGSECTKNAVLTWTSKKIKISLRGDQLVPRLVLADPELTYSMPPDITSWTGMDALTHAVESYFSSGANETTKALSVCAIKLIQENLVKAYKNGGDKKARRAMLLASVNAGFAFANAGLGAVHGLGHPVGAICKIPHGLVNAIMLPHVLKYNKKACLKEMKALEKETGNDIIETVLNMNKKMKIPGKISGVCGNAKAMAGLILSTTAYSGSMQYNPVKMDAGKTEKLLKRVL